MSEINDVVGVWTSYISAIEDWRTLIVGVEPKVGGCGLVYELPNPIDRPSESFAIADMSQLELSEPHKHANDETEIYFVLQGIGSIAVGSEISRLVPGTIIVTPPDTMHITLPKEDLVLAVVNTPPFNMNNYVVVDPDQPEVASVISELQAA